MSQKLKKTTVNSHFRQFLDGYVQVFDEVLTQVQEDSILLSIDYEEGLVSLDYSPVQLDIMGFQSVEIENNEYFNISSEKIQNNYVITLKAKGQFVPYKSMKLSYSASDYFISKIEIDYGEVEFYEVSHLTISYSNKKDLDKRANQDEISHYINLNKDGFSVLDSSLSTFTKINNLWKQ